MNQFHADMQREINELVSELYGNQKTPEGREIARYYAEAIHDELTRPLPPPHGGTRDS